MPRTAKSLRQEQRELSADMRARQCTWRQIAEEFHTRYQVNIRAALRMVRDWSQRDAAEQWNLRWPDDPKTFKNISYWELWPGSTGYAPSLDVLARLAELYECSMSDLVTDCADFRLTDLAQQNEPGSVVDPAGVSTALRRGAGPACAPEHPAVDPLSSLPGRRAVRVDLVIRAAIPAIRHCMNISQVEDNEPIPSLSKLRQQVERIQNHRVNSRYADAARQAPRIIDQLHRAWRTAGERELPGIAEMLVSAYRVADSIAYKFGYHDLSGRILDNMCSVAENAQDAALIAAVQYVRTELFLADGDLTAAMRHLSVASEQLEREGPTSCSALACLGALHMRAAVVAGRAERVAEARDYLKSAAELASRVPEDVYYGTAFGSGSVRIHALSVEAECGGDAALVERAASWNPPAAIPAERRSHYYIDLARAQTRLGNFHDAHRCINEARSVAREHTQFHPHAYQVLSVLVRRTRRPHPELMNLAAWAGVE